jgi:hypothetical protein
VIGDGNRGCAGALGNWRWELCHPRGGVLEEGSLCDRVMDSERNLWVDLGSQLVVCTINQQYNLVQHQLSTHCVKIVG